MFIKGLVGLAPMAGVADLAFRQICREFGCEYEVSEMVSAKAMTFHDKKTDALLENDGAPWAIQLFGHEPEIMAQATSMILEKKPNVIDINMGCPVPKIVSSGDGSALMKAPKLCEEVAKAVISESAGIPVSVKIRAGWDKNSINAPEIAKRLEQCGVAMICVHGRTREQLYAPGVDHKVIADVKKAVSIPVIGNGGIKNGADAVKMIEDTDCDGVMIGMGVLGAPWVFREVKAAIRGEKCEETPKIEQRLEIAMRHAEKTVALKGEKLGMIQFRKHMAWYLKGIRNAAQYKCEGTNISTLKQAYALCEKILKEQEES